MDLVIFFETRQMLERIRLLSPRGDAIINHVSRGQILNIKRAKARVMSKDAGWRNAPGAVHWLENLLKYWTRCKIFVSELSCFVF